MRTISILSAVLLLACSCTKNDTTAPGNTTTDATKSETMVNQSYGSDQRNKMDVYLPENRDDKTPFVLLIHGGGWVSGDKKDMNALQDSFRAHGIASASISYRYASPSVHYTELMEDVDKAVKYCKQQSATWHTRSSRIIMGGVSAGAHMSLLYSYKYDNSNMVSAVISAAGPTDITDISWLNYAALIGQLNNIQNMVGATYTLNQSLPAAFTAASPVKAVKNVPTLMIHGDMDMVVYHSQSQSLAATLNKAGITNKLLTIPGANHDLGVSNAATLNLIITEMEQWIRLYSK